VVRTLTRGRRSVLLFCLSACASGVFGQTSQDAAAAPAPWRPGDGEDWTLEWPTDLAKVTYLGLSSHDGAGLGPGGGMLYPAPNLGGFIVAVLTHAALNEGAKSAQRAAAQAQADKVLEDYRPTIDAFEPADLVRRIDVSLGRGVSRSDSAARWMFQVRPVFWMTQDRQALIVDNELQVRERGEGQPIRRSVVRVVGAPLAADGAARAWSEGDWLKQHSAALLARAVRLSMEDLAGRWRAETTYRTVRFAEGGDERIERAQVLDEHCGRAVIRNLRGDLIEVPRPSLAGADPASCSVMPSAGALSAPAAATGS
jgi:hypothetical protein